MMTCVRGWLWFGIIMGTGVLLVCWPALNPGEAAEPAKELVFLNWSDYIDPELIHEFEQRFQVEIKEVYYETDEMKDEMLLEQDGAGYDVVLGSGISILSYLKRDWIIPLNRTQIPNMRHIESRWMQAHPEIEGYAVPYLWGTLGIAYRRDVMSEPVTSWRQLYQPAEALRGKIMMIKDSNDTIGPALKALDYPLNSQDPAHYDEVEDLLLAQKPFVSMYSYIAITEESALVSGEIWMTPAYNGDALAVQEHHPDIAFVVPEEGTNLWIDYLVVLRASHNQELALQFINFLHEPHNAARLAFYTNFATPNRAAKTLLPPEHLTNPVIYPPSSVLERSEFYQELPPKIQKRRNMIFLKLLQ